MRYRRDGQYRKYWGFSFYGFQQQNSGGGQLGPLRGYL